jgi:hypothetical protein
MAEITPFAGLEALLPGEPLSSDGYRFQLLDRFIIDRLLRVGAVTHRHDQHDAMANPTAAPVVSTAPTGGVIPANAAISVTYTLLDGEGGETLPAGAAAITMPGGYQDPFDEPVAVVDHSAGTLLAGNYSYAATVTDGRGGETALGPAALVGVDPGFAASEVALSGLAALLSDASGGDSLAGWRLWRSRDGSLWYLIATGVDDTLTDDGIIGDCTVAPPNTGTTQGANTLSVTVPSAGQPTDAVSFNVYVSIDGSFSSPALLGNYPISQYDSALVYTALTVGNGQPPVVSTCVPGANRINPDTDIVNWYWKAPVDSALYLPMSGNNDGDARVTRDTNLIWVWDSGAGVWNQWNPAGASLLSSQRAANYTLALADAGTVVEFTGGSSVTLTVPTTVTVGLPVGTVVEVFQLGSGQVTVAPASGVTLRAHGGLLHTAAQYATISLRKRDTDEWVVSGDLA